MFQSRSFSSSEPLRKYLSSMGWKSTAVTKSEWLKTRRHSSMLMCHRRTVLSIDELRRNCVLDHDRSSTSALWPT